MSGTNVLNHNAVLNHRYNKSVASILLVDETEVVIGTGESLAKLLIVQLFVENSFNIILLNFKCWYVLGAFDENFELGSVFACDCRTPVFFAVASLNFVMNLN